MSKGRGTICWPQQFSRQQQRAAFQPRKFPMRAVNFVVVASGFATIFIGIALISALVTGAVHSQLPAKLPQISVVTN
jgi:hypothetical protein